MLEWQKIFDYDYPANNVVYDGRAITGAITLTCTHVNIFGGEFTQNTLTHEQLYVLDWALGEMQTLLVKMRGQDDIVFKA